MPQEKGACHASKPDLSQWYGDADQVPTWHYVAVHLRGVLELLPIDALRPHLERLSVQMEAQLLPNPAWTMDKMRGEALARLMRMTLPFRLVISAVESTMKLGQNKTGAQRAGAADPIAGMPLGMGPAQIAQMMRAKT